LPWVDAEFGMIDQTARNMMNVAEKFDGNRKRVSDLRPKALYLLASPAAEFNASPIAANLCTVR
jgi:hypothetical protein